MKKPVISYNTYHDLYAFLLFVNFVVLGFFAIRPSIGGLVAKRDFLKEIETKKAYFDSLEETAKKKDLLYEQVSPFLEELNEAYPMNPQDDLLVEDFVSLVGKGGYKLKSASFERNSGVITEAQLTLEGRFTDLSKLLLSLNEYPGSLQVESLQVSLSEKRADQPDRINIRLSLYSLAGKDI